MPTWVLAFGTSSILSVGALWRGSLTWDGAIAACLVGGSLWVGLGGSGFWVLCVFFFTSTLLGRVGKARKLRFESHYAKGHRRDAWQVLANGGTASLCATLLWWQDYMATGVNTSDRLGEPLAIAACASLASANADTWATELGVFSRRQPWHLLAWRRVAAGTSGAVSALGCVVAALGAGTVALAAWAAGAGFRAGDAFNVTVLGFAGSLLDSVLGATAQKQYLCPVCREEVEVASHCSVPTQAVGPRWARLGNDGVNFVANAVVAAGAWFVAR